jgi:hypothetical protein
MSYLDDIADAVWTAATRTLDAGSPAASDGSYLDDVAYAVWTNGTRTLDGGTTFKPYWTLRNSQILGSGV